MADQKQEEKKDTPDLDTLEQKSDKTAEDWRQLYHMYRSLGDFNKAAQALKARDEMKKQPVSQPPETSEDQPIDQKRPRTA